MDFSQPRARLNPMQGWYARVIAHSTVVVFATYVSYPYSYRTRDRVVGPCQNCFLALVCH